MSAGRVVVATIGIAFSVFCMFVAIVTFLGKNVAASHMYSYYRLGFAALYAVLSPLGLSGLLGAIHRKKALIRGFLWQYWIGTFLIIGANSVSVLFAHGMANRLTTDCEHDNFFLETPVDCSEKTRSSQMTALIAAIAQGSVLIIAGLILLIVGRREFKDIQIDEDTSSLLERANFESKEKPDPFGRFASPTINKPETTYSPNAVYRATSNNNSAPYNTAYGVDRKQSLASTAYGLDRKQSLASTAYGLDRNTSITSSASSYGLNRQAGYGRRPTNGRDWYLQPNSTTQKTPRSNGLYRQPTNASTSTYASERTLPPTVPDASTYERLHPHPLAPTYVKAPERSYVNDVSKKTPSPYMTYGGGVQSDDGPRSNAPPADDFDNYWQPAAAKTLASNLTRMNMY